MHIRMMTVAGAVSMLPTLAGCENSNTPLAHHLQPS